MQISSIEIDKLNNYEFIISIDEAGRGPLAGPVTIAGILLDNKSLKKIQLINFHSIKYIQNLSDYSSVI